MKKTPVRLYSALQCQYSAQQCACIAHYSANSQHNSAPVWRTTVLVTKNNPNLSFYHLTFSPLPYS